MAEQIITFRDAKHALKIREYHIRRVATCDEISYYDIWKYCTYGRDLKPSLTEADVITFANKVKHIKPVENVQSCTKCYHYWLNKRDRTKDETCFGRADARSCYRNADDSHEYRVRKPYRSRHSKGEDIMILEELKKSGQLTVIATQPLCIYTKTPTSYSECFDRNTNSQLDVELIDDSYRLDVEKRANMTNVYIPEGGRCTLKHLDPNTDCTIFYTNIECSLIFEDEPIESYFEILQ